MSVKVAIIGAGIAGIAAGCALRDRGASVIVFDKGRAAGGRVCTGRSAELTADHGAQYFTAREPNFRALIDRLLAANIVARWQGPFRTLRLGTFGPDPQPDSVRYCGVPGMSALPRAMSLSMPICLGVQIERTHRHLNGWQLVDASGVLHGPFDSLVLALPPAQAAMLLPATEPMRAVFSRVRMAPTLCAVVSFAAMPTPAAGGLFVDDPALSWVAHDGGKPMRSGAATFVLHSTAPFAHQHWDADAVAWGALLVASFARALGVALPAVLAMRTHRFRYAQCEREAQEGLCVHDAEQQLIAVGDYAAAGRVEGAWRSGVAGAALIRIGQQ